MARKDARPIVHMLLPDDEQDELAYLRTPNDLLQHIVPCSFVQHTREKLHRFQDTATSREQSLNLSLIRQYPLETNVREPWPGGIQAKQSEGSAHAHWDRRRDGVEHTDAQPAQTLRFGQERTHVCELLRLSLEVANAEAHVQRGQVSEKVLPRDEMVRLGEVESLDPENENAVGFVVIWIQTWFYMEFADLRVARDCHRADELVQAGLKVRVVGGRVYLEVEGHRGMALGSASSRDDILQILAFEWDVARE